MDQALEGLPADQRPIHHSDRGCQYCCHEYVGRLQERGLEISMTEVMHCYENAQAERVNGILKQEYEMDRTFRTKAQAQAAFHQAVWLYNHRRPHLMLDYGFPSHVHAGAAGATAVGGLPPVDPATPAVGGSRRPQAALCSPPTQRSDGPL